MYALALRRLTVRKDSYTPELRILTTLDADWQTVRSRSFSCQIMCLSRTTAKILFETKLGAEEPRLIINPRRTSAVSVEG